MSIAFLKKLIYMSLQRHNRNAAFTLAIGAEAVGFDELVLTQVILYPLAQQPQLQHWFGKNRLVFLKIAIAGIRPISRPPKVDRQSDASQLNLPYSVRVQS